MEQVPLSLPASILPSVNGVLSVGCTSQFVRVQPNNQNTIVSATSAALGASVTVPSIISFPAVPLEFTVPSGSNKNVFIDTSKSTLQFRVKYEVVAAGTAYTIDSYLQGSAHSWFERLTEKVNGMVTDDQVGWDVACNSDLNWSYNVADRDANALSLGILGEPPTIDSANLIQGHNIPIISRSTSGALAVGSNLFSYAIPLKSAMIGVDAKSMFPIGRAGKVDLTLYTPNTAPITILSTNAAGGASATVRITMDQIFLEFFYVTLDEQSASLLPSPAAPWSMAGVTHRVGNGQLPAAGGSVSVQVPLRVKSARSLSTRFVDSTVDTTGSVNGKYDSKCPLVTSMSYYLAGQKRVPNVPHSTQFALANVFNHTLQAYYDGGMDRLKSKCGMSADGFAGYIKTAAAPTAANGFDQNLIDAGSDTVAKSLGGFEFAEDLRLASTSNFLNGTDLTSSNSYLEINQSASYPSNIQYLTFIAKADIIYIVLPNGNVEVRV